MQAGNGTVATTPSSGALTVERSKFYSLLIVSTETFAVVCGEQKLSSNFDLVSVTTWKRHRFTKFSRVNNGEDIASTPFPITHQH